MRQAFNDYAIIVDDKNDNQFLGIALGYDYCAEHEWGIKGIKRDFGIPEPSKKKMGVKSRTITKCKNLEFKREKYQGRTFAILYTYTIYAPHTPQMYTHTGNL